MIYDLEILFNLNLVDINIIRCIRKTFNVFNMWEILLLHKKLNGDLNYCMVVSRSGSGTSIIAQ